MKILKKDLGWLAAEYLEVENRWTSTQAGGWEVLSTSPNSLTAINSGYIDLGGLSMEEKTIFVKNFSTQMATLPQITSGSIGDHMLLQLTVTDQPISFPQDIAYGAGFPLSLINAENVLIQRTQNWTITQNAGSFGSVVQLTGDVSSGLMASTASDRLYYTYYFALVAPKTGPPPLSTSTGCFIPSFRIVLAAEVKEEAEYKYLMRLMRSYELQQKHDED